MAEPESAIRPEDVPLYDDGEAPEEHRVSPSIEGPFHEVKDRVIASFERDYLTQLLTRAGGNMSKAARQAHIDRTTLYRLMEKHGLNRTDLPE